MNRRIFRQSQVRSEFLVVVKIRSQNVPQAAFMEDENVVKTFPPDRANQSFNISILPWRAWCAQDFLDAHAACGLRERFAVA